MNTEKKQQITPIATEIKINAPIDKGSPNTNETNAYSGVASQKKSLTS